MDFDEAQELFLDDIRLCIIYDEEADRFTDIDHIWVCPDCAYLLNMEGEGETTIELFLPSRNDDKNSTFKVIISAVIPRGADKNTTIATVDKEGWVLGR
jgi:hypothetical protein